MNKLTLDVEKLHVETFPTAQEQVLPQLEGGTFSFCCSGGVTCGTCPPPIV